MMIQLKNLFVAIVIILSTIDFVVSTDCCKCKTHKQTAQRIKVKPPQITFVGESCDCLKDVPYKVKVPIEKRPNHKIHHKYDIHVPHQSIKEPTCLYDFNIVKPVSIKHQQCKQKLKANIQSIAESNPDSVERQNDSFKTVKYVTEPPQSIVKKHLKAKVDTITLPKPDCVYPEKEHRCPEKPIIKNKCC